MATATTRNVSIRLAVVEGEKARRELTLTGDTGERALRRIKDATQPASRSLIAINAVSQEVRLGMEGLAGGVGSVGSVLGRLGPIGLAAAAVLGGLAIATAKSIAAFKESEQSANRLATALTTTGYAAGLTAREISDLAEELERTTLFSDEQAQDAASALLYFGNIAEDTLKRALRVSLDYAQANQIDVVAAARQVGRALQDPTEGLKKLEGVTTELTEAEKELIKRFSETGNVAAAQAIILDKLSGSIGGQAAGANKGLTGATNTLGDEWDKLLESFGQTVSESTIATGSINLLTAAITGLRQAVAPTRSEEITGLQEEIREYETSLLRGRLDAAFGLEAPDITATRKRLAEFAEEDRKEEEAQQEADRKRKQKAIANDNEALLGIEREYQKNIKEITQTEREKLLEEAEQAKARIQGLFKEDGNADAARSATSAVDENLRLRLAKLDQEAVKPALQLAEANQKLVATLEKRLQLEGTADPRARFIQAETDKLNASATKEYRDRVAELAGLLYDLQEAEKRAQEASENRTRAIEQITQAVLETNTGYDVAKQALDQWREKLISDLGGATQANQRYLEQIEEIYTVRLKEIYDKSLLDSDKWEDGATRALRRYADEATNAAKNAEELFGSAARKVEDTLTEMITTGEISFNKLGDLVQSIQQDILRMFIRENITGPIAGGLSDIVRGGGSGNAGGGGILGGFFDDIFASIFHDGGRVGETGAPRRAVPSYAFAGAPRLHSGLMPDEFPAILQRGETVLPKNASMGSSPSIVMNINTQNAQSFMDSQGQIMSRLAGQMQRFRTRNN